MFSVVYTGENIKAAIFPSKFHLCRTLLRLFINLLLFELSLVLFLKEKCKILHILLLDFTNLSHALKCEDNLRIILSLTPLSGGSDGKESACNAGDSGLIPGLGRSPGEGKGNPLQYSCLENSMDRGAWRVTVHGVSKSWI